MKNFINIVKIVLFLGAGLGLVFIRYETFRTWFPQAPQVAVVKGAGVVSLLCGIIILVLVLSER